MSFIEYRNIIGVNELFLISLPRNFIKGLINPDQQYILHQESVSLLVGNKLITAVYALFFYNLEFDPFFFNRIGRLLWKKSFSLCEHGLDLRATLVSAQMRAF